ncbi:helix-turn-helix domain protein [Escherichia phage Ioannina]|nr:helix-turn-helix domain protein [Escherichia phage Ioannina]
MNINEAIEVLSNAIRGETGKSWYYTNAVGTLLFEVSRLSRVEKELTAKLELLNGTAASKLQKHNEEMEEYKKQVIRLREEGKSWAMIAELTGINQSTVRSWVRNTKTAK